MIFSQVYPISTYFLILVFFTFFSFIFVLFKKRTKKNLLLFPSNINEEILKTVDGIGAKFEIANLKDIGNILKGYKNCIYIIDTSKNLDEEIKKLKQISTNFENFYIISFEGKRKRIGKWKIYSVKNKEELRDLVTSLISK